MLRPMRKLVGPLWLLLAIFLGCGGDDGGGAPSGPAVPVKVMTRNLYLGADLLPVVTTKTIEEIPPAVAALWTKMLASDIPARAKQLAAEIATAQPDLVGLQEAVIFYKQSPGDFSFAKPEVNAKDVAFDFVKLLLDELTMRGTEYQTAVILENTDVELPAADPAVPFDVRMTDRDVILAKKSVAVSNPMTAHYKHDLIFSIPFLVGNGPQVHLMRGLSRVDAVVGGAHFTFANTHLEVGSGGSNVQASAALKALQEGQAADLLELLAPVTGPVVLVGDFNSAAVATPTTTMSYRLIANAFTDAWSGLYPGMPGFTCCLDITAPAPMLGERIDIVFYRGGVKAQSAEVLGADPAKHMAGAPWPSDHAGVAASIEVPGGSGTGGAGGSSGAGGTSGTGGAGGKKY
jgi:endonuclease/exonuclease/phosphatase family metal-dependent hydrolase